MAAPGPTPSATSASPVISILRTPAAPSSKQFKNKLNLTPKQGIQTVRGGNNGSPAGSSKYTITSPKMKKSTTADVKEAAAKIKDQRFRGCTIL